MALFGNLRKSSSEAPQNSMIFMVELYGFLYVQATTTSSAPGAALASNVTPACSKIYASIFLWRTRSRSSGR
jgi:hypothetical protein